MRVIRTFILRLLVDSAEPEALRGDQQPISEGKVQPFPLRMGQKIFRPNGERVSPEMEG